LARRPIREASQCDACLGGVPESAVARCQRDTNSQVARTSAQRGPDRGRPNHLAIGRRSRRLSFAGSKPMSFDRNTRSSASGPFAVLRPVTADSGNAAVADSDGPPNGQSRAHSVRPDDHGLAGRASDSGRTADIAGGASAEAGLNVRFPGTPNGVLDPSLPIRRLESKPKSCPSWLSAAQRPLSPGANLRYIKSGPERPSSNAITQHIRSGQ